MSPCPQADTISDYIGLDPHGAIVQVPVWGRCLVRGATEVKLIEAYLAMFPDLRPDEKKEAIRDYLDTVVREESRRGYHKPRPFSGGLLW